MEIETTEQTRVKQLSAWTHKIFFSLWLFSYTKEKLYWWGELVVSNVNGLHEDVKKVKSQMVNKVLDQNEQLDNLDIRAENLNSHAGKFQVLSTWLKRSFGGKTFDCW